jgi:hypothetical protein
LAIFSVCLEKVLFVLVVSILIQNTETNWKKIVGFAQTNQKQTKQIEFWFVSV